MNDNFAIIGCGGFIAPRHLKAIEETGNKLIAALDSNDSVGLLDKYSYDVNFFTEFERFDRHVEKLRMSGDNKKIDFVTICSPNYLHDAHIRFAFRIGADAICEKPLVLNPWNLNSLEKLEKTTKQKVYTVLQLRLHPSIIDLKKKIDNGDPDKIYDVDLTYITPRGKWYDYSWKGKTEKSGGISTNIGIHFFDMLIWIFGKVKKYEVHYSDNKKMSGYLELERAKVKWFLSLDKKDYLGNKSEIKPFRSIKINEKELEFSEVFTDLHTKVYQDIFNGNGFGIKDARPSIELVYQLRKESPKISSSDNVHSMLIKK